MVVHVRRPRTVEGYKSCSIHGAHKDVLRDKIAFAPSQQMITTLQTMQCRVPALAHMHEPVPVRVIAMLEPFVDEHVGRVVVESFADEFAHGDARGLYWGVKPIFLVGIVEGWDCVVKVLGRNQAKGVQPNEKVTRPKCVAYLIRLPPPPSHSGTEPQPPHLSVDCSQKNKEYVLGFIQVRWIPDNGRQAEKYLKGLGRISTPHLLRKPFDFIYCVCIRACAVARSGASDSHLVNRYLTLTPGTRRLLTRTLNRFTL